MSFKENLSKKKLSYGWYGKWFYIVLIFTYSNINIYNITIGQRSIIGNPMACNIIHRCAYRFREHRVSKRWWICIWCYCFIVNKFIDFLCRQSWLPIWKRWMNQCDEQNFWKLIVWFTFRRVEHISRILAANLQLLRIANTEFAIFISGFGDLNISGSSAT